MGFESEDQLHDDDYYCEECKPELHTDFFKYGQLFNPMFIRLIAGLLENAPRGLANHPLIHTIILLLPLREYRAHTRLRHC